MDINILSIDQDGSIGLSVGPSPYRTIGIHKLVQQTVKILLTTPGRDLWNKGIGGGLKEIVSRRVDKDNLNDMYGQVAIAIMNTERYLLQEQLSEELPGDEKLKSLTLNSVNYSSSDDKWSIMVDVETFSGRTSSVAIS